MGSIRSRVTYPNVVSTLALFIALGGTGYAASKLGDDASRTFGSSVYFGQGYDFGPINSGAGGGNLVPMIGFSDLDNPEADAEGGPWVLLTPVPLRVRDLRMRTLVPVERPVAITISGGGAKLRCAIPSGGKGCFARGPSDQVQAAKRMSAHIDAPIADGVLTQHDFEYSFRLTPR